MNIHGYVIYTNIFKIKSEHSKIDLFNLVIFGITVSSHF